MSEREKLQELYAQIPSFKCKEGCTDCCGFIMFSKREWQKIPKKFHKPECIACPYSANGACEIYEDRPFICRLYGTVDTPRLRCPHGCAPEKMLTEAEGARLTAEYQRLKPKIRNIRI